MFFWILVIIAAGITLGFASVTFKEELAQQKKFNKHVVLETAGILGVLGLITSVIAAVVFLLVGGLIKDIDGRPQVVKTEVYNIPENSTFENFRNREFNFTYIDSHGSFAAKSVEYDNLYISGPKTSTIVVSVEDQYHDWFAPFVWGTNINILIA